MLRRLVEQWGGYKPKHLPVKSYCRKSLLVTLLGHGKHREWSQMKAIVGLHHLWKFEIFITCSFRMASLSKCDTFPLKSMYTTTRSWFVVPPLAAAHISIPVATAVATWWQIPRKKGYWCAGIIRFDDSAMTGVWATVWVLVCACCVWIGEFLSTW